MKLTGTFTLMLNDEIIGEYTNECTDEGVNHIITLEPGKRVFTTIFPEPILLTNEHELISQYTIDTLEEETS